MTLGERVVVMNDGRVMQVDAPRTLYDFPANRFVAAFIGDPAMNMIDVNLIDGAAVNEAVEVPLPPTVVGPNEGDGTDERAVAIDRATPIEAASPLVFGVHPEDLYLESERPDLGSGSIDATAEVTEPLGDSLLVHCSAGEMGFKPKAPPRTALQPGESVTVRPDPERLHLFDAETGVGVYHAAASDKSETAEPPASHGRH